MTISEVMGSRPSFYLLFSTQSLMNTLWINKEQRGTKERRQNGKRGKGGERQETGRAELLNSEIIAETVWYRLAPA